jgi:hypothetical protein
LRAEQLLDEFEGQASLLGSRSGLLDVHAFGCLELARSCQARLPEWTRTDEVMGEWDEWFDPAEGRAAMQALVDHIKANPQAARRLDDSAGVVAELDQMARVLAAAASEGVRFRLEMS